MSRNLTRSIYNYDPISKARIAIENDDLEFFRDLNLPYYQRNKEYYYPVSLGQDLLNWAVAEGSIQIANFLSKKGFRLENPRWDLEFAIMENHLEMADWIRKNYDVAPTLDFITDNFSQLQEPMVDWLSFYYPDLFE